MLKMLSPVLAAILCCFGGFLSALDADMDMTLEDDPGGEQPLFHASRKPADLKITLPSEHDALEVNLRMNQPGILKFQMEPVKGFKKSFTLKTRGQDFERTKSDDELKGNTSVEISRPKERFLNQTYRLGEMIYFIRPNFKNYPDDVVNKLLPQWENLPDALTHEARFTFFNTPRGIRIDLDGRYWKTFPDMTLKSLRITGGTGPSVRTKTFRNTANTGLWEAVNAGGIGHGGAMSAAKLSFPAGPRIIDGIPFDVADPLRSIDLFTTKSYTRLKDDTIDIYLSRKPFERNPETYMASVPNGYYASAFLLFALDPDPKKDRSFCFRMTRFNGAGRGDGFAYTDVELPAAGEPMPENIRQVGTVTLRGQSLPLYLGEFPVNSGDITDVIDHDPIPDLPWLDNRKDALEFDLLGRRYNAGNIYGTWKHYPHDVRRSAVNVFGLTLKRAPMAFHVRTKQVCNLFRDGETPETGVELEGVADGASVLGWTVSDAYGEKVLKTGRAEVSLKAGERKEIVVPLAMPDAGHYNLEFTLTERGAAKPYFRHRAAFALLGKDTRLAAPSESPFGVWWFLEGMHYGPEDPDFVMNTLNRAGIRRVSFAPDDLNSEYGKRYRAAREKYRITVNQFPWIMKFPEGTPEEVEQALHAFYDQRIKDNPETKYVLLFHESFGGDSAPELYGKKGTPGDGMWAVGQTTQFTDFMRKYHPDIKIVAGNSSIPVRCIASLLRNGVDPKRFDYVGIEAIGLGYPPEMLRSGTPASAWMVREAARAFGVEIKLTGCFEFTSRNFDILGPKKQAEFLIRDALTGLASGYRTLSIGGMPYCDPYIQSVYGAPLLSRDLYPRPVFTAYAALTKVFDQIDFQPKLRDTGALTSYALGFARKRGDFAYALWTPRNPAELKVVFDRETTIEETDFFGKQTRRTGTEFLFEVSGTPRYFTAPVDPVNILHVRALSNEDTAAKAVLSDTADSALWKAWDGNSDLGSDDGTQRVPGVIELASVRDDEQGDCLEFRLVKQGTLPAIFSEYRYFRLKQPIALPGTPDTLAAFVKGDGSWGELMFEIQDADGKLLRTGGRAGCGSDALLNFTFHGWNWIYHPLTGPGIRGQAQKNLAATGFWMSNGKGAVKYPVKLVGLYVTLRRKALNPEDMKDAPGVIRLKKLGGLYHPEFQPLPKENTK